MKIKKLTPYRIRHWPKVQVKVLVDSREQHPWDLSPMQLETATIATGDYASSCGRYLLERKNSVDELISCMTSGRDRFECELERMQAFASAIVVVEGAYTDLATGCLPQQDEQGLCPSDPSGLAAALPDPLPVLRKSHRSRTLCAELISPAVQSPSGKAARGSTHTGCRWPGTQFVGDQRRNYQSGTTAGNGTG